MENNNIEAYKKIAKLITQINNPKNFKKARLALDRISHNKKPVFKFIYTKKQNLKNEKNPEIVIAELPFLDILHDFFIDNLHKISPKNQCKSKFCECNIKYDEDRLFLLMWQLVFYFYYPEKISNWEDLNSEHLKEALSYDNESIEDYKFILQQQIKHSFSKIKNDFPTETLLDKEGLNQCLFKKEHNTEFLEIVWESKSQLYISDYIDQNKYRLIFGLNPKSESFSKFRIDKVRCIRCTTTFYILREAIIEEKRNGVWDTIYSTLSQNNSIKYISKANNLHYKIWEALQELYSTHGLTENQAEVAAKLNFDIPLKHSTLRNTKQQLKKKLGNIEKILQIWDDLEWV